MDDLTFLAIVRFRAFDATTRELEDRVRGTLGTHPTLSFRIDDVSVYRETPAIEDEIDDGADAGLWRARAQRWRRIAMAAAGAADRHAIDLELARQRDAKGDDRTAVLAYLRSLPEGGIDGLVDEAKVLEWRRYDHEGDGTRYLRAVGSDAEGMTEYDPDEAAYEACWGSLEGVYFPTEAEACAWVEEHAIADGWTIASPEGEEAR